MRARRCSSHCRRRRRRSKRPPAGQALRRRPPPPHHSVTHTHTPAPCSARQELVMRLDGYCETVPELFQQARAGARRGPFFIDSVRKPASSLTSICIPCQPAPQRASPPHKPPPSPRRLWTASRTACCPSCAALTITHPHPHPRTNTHTPRWSTVSRTTCCPSCAAAASRATRSTSRARPFSGSTPWRWT